MTDWVTEHWAGHPVDLLRVDAPAGGQTATGEARAAVVFLHPYDGLTLASQPGWTELFIAAGLSVACPHGPSCWWTDQPFTHFDPQVSPLDWLRGPFVQELEQRWQVRPPAIGLCGVEMGGQGVLQWAYREGRQFPVVAAISPKVDFETWYGYGNSLDQIFPNREAARQATCLLQVHPLASPRHQFLLCDPNDEYCFAGASVLASKLRSSGIPFEEDLRSSHGGYGWNYANAMAPRIVQFLAERLAQLVP